MTWTVATVIVFVVGVSRVYLGMHWATDVFGGWLLGSVWVAGLTLALAPLDWGRRFVNDRGDRAASGPGTPPGAWLRRALGGQRRWAASREGSGATAAWPGPR